MAGHLTLAEQAIDCFGIEAQILKFAEECCELGSDDKNPEEQADVLICIDQMKIILGGHLSDEIKNAQRRSCVIDPKALPRAASHAIKYALYLRAGWDAEEIKAKLVKAIAQAIILLDFTIGKNGTRGDVEKFKNQKEARLFDTICRIRNERSSGNNRDFYSGQASGSE